MEASASMISSISSEVTLFLARSRNTNHLRQKGPTQQGNIHQVDKDTRFPLPAQHCCRPQKITVRVKQQRSHQIKRIPYQFCDVVDAFVALGGRADKSGVVNKKALIEIVKQEFEISLDLENMIEGFEGENFDYEAFCSIFAQDRESNNGRLASVASRRSLKTEESVHSLVIE